MAFKNLADLYNEKVNDLYGAATMKFDGGKPSKGNNDDPLIVRKPGKGYWTDAESRELPISSTLQDTKRITLFTLSKRGLLFLAKQQLLQTGNTFEHTRVINPVFAIGNTVPFVHIKRNLRPLEIGGTAGNLLGRVGIKTGPTDKSTNGLIKIAQLQQETYDKLSRGQTTNLLGRTLTNLIKKIPVIGQTVSAFGAKRSVGENIDWKLSRPELNGYIYDIMNQQRGYSFLFGGKREVDTKKFINEYTSDILYSEKILTTSNDLQGRYGESNNSQALIDQQKLYLDSGEEIGSFTVRQTPYIKYFKPETQGSITGNEKQFDEQNGVESKRLVPGIKKISYMRDSFNKPIAGRPNAKLLDAYKDMPTPADLTDQDPIVVSFAMGGDEHVQFRAFITNLQQSASPEYKTYQYIGRIEKFISYVTVQRELSFKLSVIAFSKDELDMVWKRINYLTGMVFPYGYNKGILQPNIIKLTIGKLFYDQPGYVTSLSTNFNEVTESWDIDREVPIGATMDIKFNIIEKKAPTADSPFYHYLQEYVDGFPSPDISNGNQEVPKEADNATIQRTIAGDTNSLRQMNADLMRTTNSNNSIYRQPLQVSLPPLPRNIP